MDRQEVLDLLVKDVENWELSILIDFSDSKPIFVNDDIDIESCNLMNDFTITKQHWLEAKAGKEAQKWQPEIGQECEFSNDGGEFREAKYIGPNDVGTKRYLVLWIPPTDGEEYGKYDNFKQGDNIKFRPLKTKEEVEREELVKDIIDFYEYPKGAEEYLNLAKHLQGKGYKKND